MAASWFTLAAASCSLAVLVRLGPLTAADAARPVAKDGAAVYSSSSYSSRSATEHPEAALRAPALDMTAALAGTLQDDTSWTDGGVAYTGSGLVPSPRRQLLEKKDGDRIWTGAYVTSACVLMQQREQAEFKERARQWTHAYNQRLRKGGIIIGYICAAIAALYCCAVCAKQSPKQAAQQPAATVPAAAAVAAAAAGNTTPAVPPAAIVAPAVATPAPAPKAASSSCLPPLLAAKNKGGGFPVAPPKSKELAQAAKARADAALAEAVAAAAGLHRMLRGDMTATAAGIRLLPPPGWVVGGAAPGAGKPLQRMDRVQFRLLPWADPQALHEMMRQGVGREEAEVALLLHSQDGDAAAAWLAGLAAFDRRAATSPEAADARRSLDSLEQRQEVERVMRRACGVRGGLARHQVRAVFRVSNPRLWAAYIQRCQEIAEDMKTGATDGSLARNINEQMLFHASNRDALAAICAHGFDARLWRSERYGKGLYFACSATTSTGYVGRDMQADVAKHAKAAGDRLPEVGAPGRSSAWKAMLLCRTALGTVGTGSSELRRPNHGYHSSCSNAIVIGKRTSGAGGKGPRYTESVIFDGAQAYPAYLIFFAAA